MNVRSAVCVCIIALSLKMSFFDLSVDNGFYSEHFANATFMIWLKVWLFNYLTGNRPTTSMEKISSQSRIKFGHSSSQKIVSSKAVLLFSNIEKSPHKHTQCARWRINIKGNVWQQYQLQSCGKAVTLVVTHWLTLCFHIEHNGTKIVSE